MISFLKPKFSVKNFCARALSLFERRLRLRGFREIRKRVCDGFLGSGIRSLRGG